MVVHMDENERLLSTCSPLGGASSDGNSPGITGSVRSLVARLSFLGVPFLTTPLVVDSTLLTGSWVVMPLVTLSRGMARVEGLLPRVAKGSEQAVVFVERSSQAPKISVLCLIDIPISILTIRCV